MKTDEGVGENVDGTYKLRRARASVSSWGGRERKGDVLVEVGIKDDAGVLVPEGRPVARTHEVVADHEVGRELALLDQGVDGAGVGVEP
jgi:hypothetical protein